MLDEKVKRRTNDSQRRHANRIRQERGFPLIVSNNEDISSINIPDSVKNSLYTLKTINSDNDDIEVPTQDLMYEISKVSDSEKIKILKSIISDSQLNEKKIRTILTLCTPVINHFSYVDKLDFINFSNKKIQFYNEHRKYNKEDSRPLQFYQKLLNIDPLDLKNKNILLIGGGFSPIQKDLGTSNITNYDIRKIDDNPEIANKIIKGNFCHKLNKAINHNQNEVWALYSMPMYSNSMHDTISFFENAFLSLKENGVLRVFPIGQYTDNASMNPASILIVDELKLLETELLKAFEEKNNLFEVKKNTTTLKNFWQEIETQGCEITVKNPKEAVVFLKTIAQKLEDKVKASIKTQPKEIMPAEIIL